MKVLVTGGAGFIGSHLADKLLRDGHEVVVIDNESTGKRANVPPHARYVKGDVRRPEDLDQAFAGGVDAVCHIAGQVSLALSFVDPVADLRTNVEGTVNVLGSCIKHRVPRFIYASSMTAYGRTDVLPIPETAPCAPISYYGVTKYAAERYVHTTADRVDLGFDLHVTSFRMFNVFGPRQALDNPYQGVLGIFLGHLLRGEPLTIFGDGEQSRDFVYIDDVVDAWSRALTTAATYGGVFNLGSGRCLSINELARHALALFGQVSSPELVRRATARSGEQRHVEADITAVRKVLSWEPRVPFEAGLAMTYEWARSMTTGLSASSGDTTPVSGTGGRR